MSARESVNTLVGSIEKSRVVLRKLHRYYEEFVLKELDQSKRKVSDAIVIADIVSKYYTCLETVFLRISQFFENDLNERRWHQDLLEKMTFTIPDVREAVLSDAAFSLLLELLKFRHFERYYFEIDHDWEKLEFVQKKFVQVVPLVERDLDQFVAFLKRLNPER